MNRQEIKYIGFYDVRNAGEDRACALSACNKMDYIVSVMQRSGQMLNLFLPPGDFGKKGETKTKKSFEKKKSLYCSWISCL